MVRIVKAPEERRAEFVATADRPFREHGYASCSVNMIIREIGVAKETFYYFSTLKPDILQCQSAPHIDPRSASNIDPFWHRGSWRDA